MSILTVRMKCFVERERQQWIGFDTVGREICFGMRSCERITGGAFRRIPITISRCMNED